MKILNIHGFRGSAENAAFGALTGLGHDVVSPPFDYDSVTPDKVAEKLRRIIKADTPRYIVGTSYGGFFAALLSAETGIPAVLVNPCLMPFYHLPLLGYEGDIAPMIALFGGLAKADRSIVKCIIGGSDELIDTHSLETNYYSAENITVIPEGLHSGATLPLTEYFGEVIK
ncbi:YqiA/YcfP family alpha/beta fold hydrolase [uncultured Ruminococcus sp.]|uniref:YqiA/YcfP family alpha/beta fold hydrolase n=1 Tax=uncultured Ruminococcus sp. TaxID=165186 RepID=UPI0025DED7C3|nr:YqiA/YcfP family alpha/beta fold hydrolase [uncultured Ruminococcus sp.]